MHVTVRYGAFGGQIPRVFGPFLKKVWVALCVSVDLINGLVRELNTKILGWFGDGRTRILPFQRADHGEVEQPFRVRLGIASQRTKLWQPSTYHRDGQFE